MIEGELYDRGTMLYIACDRCNDVSLHRYEGKLVAVQDELYFPNLSTNLYRGHMVTCGNGTTITVDASILENILDDKK